MNDKNSGFVQFVRFTNHQPNNDSGLAIVDRGSRYLDHQNSGGAQLATVLSPALLNELRFGTIQRDTADYPVVSSSPAGDVLTNITSVADIGFRAREQATTPHRYRPMRGIVARWPLMHIMPEKLRSSSCPAGLCIPRRPDPRKHWR